MMAALARTELDQLTDAIDNSKLTAWDYLTAVAILVGAVVVGRIFRIVVRRLVGRSRTDDLVGDLIGRIGGYLVVTFGFVYAIDRLGIAIGPILGALGIVGIALAFAFQDILENFVAGIILQVQRPFGSGDEIVVADHEGRICAVDTRTITIETPDGETIRIPSSEVIKNPIINHTQMGRRRTTVDVGVAYDTDLDRATAVALDAVSGLDEVLASPPPDVMIHTFGESSIDMAVRFWHEPSIASMWRTRHLVATTVSKAFTDNGIKIPFPQRVLHVADGDESDSPG
ncbi:MAG: mechanosensitive ion channel family protein [Acidimicrobiales bacterium]